MAKKMVINTEKFVEFLDSMIAGTYVAEMKANKSEHPDGTDYIEAYNAVSDRRLCAYIMELVTGEPICEGLDGDYGWFMEEVDES